MQEERFAAAFAEMALDLSDGAGEAETVDRVTEYALHSVGCDYAGVMLVHRHQHIEVAASTDPLVAKIEQLQLDFGEGPCMAAITQHDSFLVNDTRTDDRWPQWAAQVATLGVRSVLSVRLFTRQTDLGSLNLFALQPDAFDHDDDAVAHILAQHASVALAAARQESTLWQAIDARKLIGQAQGILMERFDLTAEDAFSVLRRYSQDNNVKLREVAQRLLDTRQLPR
ncbi:MAG: GAF and ANTAR domain-containing protein [Nocardioidaceae bacterium]